MPDVKVAILGGGHAAFAHAADLSIRGFEVRLYEVPELADTIAAVKERGGIDCEPDATTGLKGGFGRVKLVTTDAGEALDGADVAFVVVPAFAHQAFARLIAPHVKEDQVIVLSPGNFGGTVTFARGLRQHGCRALPLLAEAQSMIYACRKGSPTSIRIFGYKHGLRVAVFPARQTARVMAMLRQVFSTLEPAQNVLWTWLSNPNAIAHPPVTILNAGRVEATGGDFLFYVDGMTPSVMRVVEALDDERMYLGAGLGLALMPYHEMTKTWYGHQGYQGPNYPDKARNPVYYAIKAESELNSRYLTEDVPYGLVPWEDLGRLAGVEMPVCSSLIDLADSLLGVDFRANGQTLARIGLGDLDAEGLLHLVEEGE